MEDGLLRIAGAQETAPDKYVSLATIKFIGGLQTQRSAYTGIDTRYNTKFLGGKPDALISGSNVEISNALTLQRRPGLIAYGTANIPAPVDFYDWQLATTNDIILVIDTSTSGGDNSALANGAVFNYSPTNSGIYINKAAQSKQTNFFDIVNTLYMGDGVDLFKVVGPNLLTWSNTFGTGAGTNFSIQSPWTETDIFALTGGQADPLGGTAATQLIWSTTGSAPNLTQIASGGTGVTGSSVPNYTPVASNTFTFSVWMKETGLATSVTIEISDQSGVVASKVCALTSSWVKYQITGTMNSGSTEVKVSITNPTTTNTMVIYGAQLEVGGPATTTQITTTKPQGVYLWGITAPTTAPTLSYSNAVGNTGAPWQPSTFYSVGQTIVDTNGNLQEVTTAGTSGTSQPDWNTQPLGTTADGAQNLIVQTVTSGTPASANNASVTLPNNVTQSNMILVTIIASHPQTLSISDTQGNTYTPVLANPYWIASGQFAIYVYYVRSAASGATTINVTGGGNSGTYIAAAEIEDQTGQDGTIHNENAATYSASGFFYTGNVTTVNPSDMVVSIAAFACPTSTGAGTNTGVIPSGYTLITGDSGMSIAANTFLLNVSMCFNLVSTAGYQNPLWTILNPNAHSQNTGVTVPFKSSVGSLIWTNEGTSGAGLTTILGYQYYYAYMNSYTGHVSNVSPISVSTGVITGQVINVQGAVRTMANSGAYDEDPQSDVIAIFRNTDGGGFWYQVAQIGNGSAAQAALVAADYGVSTDVTYNGSVFNFSDTVIDDDLNTSIYAPIGLLNSPPPAGLKNMEYFAGRMWGSVANILYYNSGPDNASLLSVTQNAVPSEAWAPANYIPFNSPITRSIAVGNGLLVHTTTDTWYVTGQNLLSGGFNPQKVLPKHGLRSYNAADLDGSTVYIFTGDREALSISPNAGSVEVGFPIGDTLETSIDPLTAYFVRHVSGSKDNAVFLADGSTGWYRLNPNQQGASMSGEVTPLWSPKADFTASIGGIGAIASMETSPGTIQLLVGQLGVGPVLVRSLLQFSDNGTSYAWDATIGSILLTTPGKLAESESITTEMNNISNAANQCGVAVLLDEISGSFESLPLSVNDPPQLDASVSVLSNRFYLSQGTEPPICRHLQIQLSGSDEYTTKDELLALTIRGALVPEQT